MSDSPQRIFAPEPTDDARAVKVRLAVLQPEERPPAARRDEPQAMTFPHLIIREAVAFLALSLFLTLLALAVDAPLEEMADPEKTPNPAKAPWYFLGLQELLHYYPPVVAGVILPGLVVVALVVVPYFDVNLRREALWTGRNARELAAIVAGTLAVSAVFYFTAAHPVWAIIAPTLAVGTMMALPGALGTRGPALRWLAMRSLAFYVFLWFLVVGVVLTVIGTLFRGPGWGFTLPWRDGIY